MAEIIVPPVMGMFCTGYALHLGWRKFQVWRFARRIRAFEIEVTAMQSIVWMCAADKANEVRRAA